MGDRRVAYRVWWTGLVERDHFENLCLEGRIILKLIPK